MNNITDEEFKKINVRVCPTCGGELIDYNGRNSLGLKCKNCDFSIVRAWIPLSEYPSEYKIIISKPAQMDAAKYKALSKISGLNYLQLKEAPVGTEFSERYGIYDTWKIIEFLNECGVEHVEEPEFPFSSKEEMKEKLMLDDF